MRTKPCVFVALMEQGRVVDLDRATALEAARLSVQHRIAMADSIMLSTALRNRATLWTQDADFQRDSGSKVLPQTLTIFQTVANEAGHRTTAGEEL